MLKKRRLPSLLLAILAAEYFGSQFGIARGSIAGGRDNRLQDLAVLGALQANFREIRRLPQSRRIAVTKDLDLVVALGGRDWSGKETPYPEPRTLGLFLQRREQPSLVYRLCSMELNTESLLRIERATATDLVLSRTDEKSAREPNLKFLFDPRAKACLQRLTYAPWFMGRVLRRGDELAVVATNRERIIAIELDPEREPPWRVRSGADGERWTTLVGVHENWEGFDRRRALYFDAERVDPVPFGRHRSLRLVESRPDEYEKELVVEEAGGGNRRYTLPQSTLAELKAGRPGLFEYGASDPPIGESIGGWDIEGDRLWVGKTFYDGEGDTGMGGFGFFDEATKTFRIESPPELREWSIDALHVDADAIWMALTHHGEWGDSGGGIARYDRSTKNVEVLPFRDVGKQFARVGGKLLLVGDSSVAFVSADGVRAWFIDPMSDGRLRAAEGLNAVSFEWY